MTRIHFWQGADSVIFERLAPVIDDLRRVTREQLEQFGSSGLRTLCLAYRDLSPDMYESWNEKFIQAKSSLRDREKKLDEVYPLGNMFVNSLEFDCISLLKHNFFSLIFFLNASLYAEINYHFYEWRYFMFCFWMMLYYISWITIDHLAKCKREEMSQEWFFQVFIWVLMCDSLWSSIWTCLIQNLNWGNCHKNDFSNPLFVDINLLVFLNTFLFVRESVPPPPKKKKKKSCHPENFDTGLLFIYTVVCFPVSFSYKKIHFCCVWHAVDSWFLK